MRLLFGCNCSGPVLSVYFMDPVKNTLGRWVWFEVIECVLTELWLEVAFTPNKHNKEDWSLRSQSRFLSAYKTVRNNKEKNNFYIKLHFLSCSFFPLFKTPFDIVMRKELRTALVLSSFENPLPV